MKMRFFMITLVSFIFILELEEILSDDVIMQKSFYDTDMEPIQEQRKKKPFCNAFTGCGRKRSDDAVVSIDEMTGRTIEELARQARFWEFIQNLSQKLKEQKAASRELLYPSLNYGRKRCGLGNYLC